MAIHVSISWIYNSGYFVHPHLQNSKPDPIILVLIDTLPTQKLNQKMPKKNLSGDGTAAPIDAWWWLSHKGTTTSFLCISLFALLIRSAVSMFPYSGAGTPPKFGDFEAQRHWMEITTNLPATDWYRNGTHNDLTYWGLDYPPLTAYQSYIHGILLRFFNPESVSLFSSRGHESYIG